MPQDDYEKYSPEAKKYTGPSIPWNGDHIHALLGVDEDFSYLNPGSYEIGAEGFWDEDPRNFHEIGQSTFYEIGAEEVKAFSRSFDANPPRLTGKVNYYTKKDKLITCAQVYIPATDTCMIVSVRTPLKPIMKMLEKGANAAMFGLDDSDFYEIGWNPWKSVKKGAKHLGRTAKKVGKKLSEKAIRHTVQSKSFKRLVKKTSAVAQRAAKGAAKVAKNPYVQKFATGAAVATAMYFGVPPNVTMAATGVLFSAINGDPVSLDKVQNVAELAAEGYEPAQKMKAVMSTLYKGGMKDMKPYLQQAQAVASTNFAEKSRAIAEQALPSEFKLPTSAPGSMFPFNIPGFDYGPPISGWLYNVPYREQVSKQPVRSLYHSGMNPEVSGWFYNKPYRSNLQARELDVFGKGRNPFHLLRGAYSQGMK